MNVLYEEEGELRVGAVLSSAPASFQVESPHGRRSKVKASHVLLTFAQPGPAELLAEARRFAGELDTDFLWQCCGAAEFGFADLARDYVGRDPGPAEAAGVLLKLHSAPVYFYRRGRGRFQAAPEATLKLMNTLVACRYLRHRTGRYELTSKARKWLLGSSPHSIADKLLFQYDEWDIVAKYEDYLTTGQPLDLHGSLTDPAAWNRYQLGMRAVASISAGEVAKRLPVPAGATSMLDIGGSHGYYSVCACRRYEGLRATILDLPQAIEHAAPIAARHRAIHRLQHIGQRLHLGTELHDSLALTQAKEVLHGH